MPAKDKLHEAVRNALVRDGWTVTDDPLRLKVPGRQLYVDLGAERLLAAQMGAVTIAVEVKSFLGPSDVRDLEEALGQFMVYELVLREVEPSRTLFLAVPEKAWNAIFSDALGSLVLRASRAIAGPRPDAGDHHLMDTVEAWRDIVERILTEYATPYRYGDVRTEVVFDRARDRYLVVDTGWERGGRVYGTIVHVDIIDGRIWVQHDGTDRPVALELVDAGIPRDMIVLGFREPELRKYTGFAAA